MLKIVNHMVLIFFIAAMIIGCTNNKLVELDENIQNYLLANKDKKNVVLRLDTISYQTWDEILLIAPYTSLNDLSKQLNYDLHSLPKTIEHYDSFILVAFINENHAVKYIEVQRNNIFDSYIKSNENHAVIKKEGCIFYHN